jgi:hypothetical protein
MLGTRKKDQLREEGARRMDPSKLTSEPCVLAAEG